jgi:hypothetical protein
MAHEFGDYGAFDEIGSVCRSFDFTSSDYRVDLY